MLWQTIMMSKKILKNKKRLKKTFAFIAKEPNNVQNTKK